MSEKKDYTKKVFTVTFLVILMLVLISFIPPFRIGGVTIKRANILSDIIIYDDQIISTVTSEDLLDTSFLADMSPEILDIEVERKETKPAASYDDIVPLERGDKSPSPKKGTAGSAAAVPNLDADGIIYIEDFSDDGMMDNFYRALAYEASYRPVRIAVMGDSFTEGDIIVGDIREQLQLAYGGSGVGFVPFDSPLSKHRGTVQHTFSGWENHNVVKKKDTPEEYKELFFVSGNLCIPTDGAKASYKGVGFRQRLDRANTASLLFINNGDSELTVTINDQTEKYYKLPQNGCPDGFIINHEGINKLDVTVTKADGLIGYGVVLEDDTGVSVHNFPIRGNSGLALFGTDRTVNTSFGEMMNYDLIILQYGLNAMSEKVTDYGYYGKQLHRIIEYIKLCFPESAVVVMSVGDRSTLESGRPVTMAAAKAMLETQREAAMKSGVGFWNTFEAMGGENSMPEFVKRGWAAKDYTHIGYGGGKYIAGRFVDAVNAQVAALSDPYETTEDAATEIIPLPSDDSPETDIYDTETVEETDPLYDELLIIDILPIPADTNAMQTTDADTLGTFRIIRDTRTGHSDGGETETDREEEYDTTDGIPHDTNTVHFEEAPTTEE